jgi:hypothetical protein
MTVTLAIAVALLVFLYSQNSGLTVGSVVGGILSHLSSEDILTYAANAGFTEPDLDVAVAIAQAESSGNPSAIGDVALAPTNGPSIGLWQINIGSKAHGSQYTQEQLIDPQQNANAAYAIYTRAGGQFSDWTTFSTGAYLAYMPSTYGNTDQSA